MLYINGVLKILLRVQRIKWFLVFWGFFSGGICYFKKRFVKSLVKIFCFGFVCFLFDGNFQFFIK